MGLAANSVCLSYTTPGRVDAINLRNSFFLHGSLLFLLFPCTSLGTALTHCREVFFFPSFKNIFSLFASLLNRKYRVENGAVKRGIMIYVASQI